MSIAVVPRESSLAEAPDCFSAHLEPRGHPVLSGRLDIKALSALRAVLGQALLEPGDIIAIDAGALTFVDQAAIQELLRYELAAAVYGKRLWLESAPIAFVQDLDLLDLRHVLLRPEVRTTI